MRWILRTTAVLAVLGAIVVVTGLAFAGLPAVPKHLPTGRGVSLGAGRNVLTDPDFSRGGRIARGWMPEYSTVTRPFYRRRDHAEEIAYTGRPGDTGLHRKIEIFQANWHRVHGGDRWRFSIRVKGQLYKAYMIVGIEWFAIHKPLYHYIAEQDVYPQPTTTWQRVTVVTPPLPSNARAIAAYVQLPEINHMSRINVWISGPSLKLTAGT